MSKLEEILGSIEDETLRGTIKAAHDEDVSGLKAHQATLMDEAKQAKRAKQEFEGKASKYDELYGVVGDRDRERLAEVLKDYDNGKLVKAGQEGDTEELKRRLREQWDVETKSKYGPVIEELDSVKGKLEATQSELKVERIDSRIQAAATEFGISGGNLKLVTMLAKEEWDLEDGDPVARDKDGNILVGKEGAMTPKEWVDGPLRERYGDTFYPKPVGGGAPGNNGARGAKKWGDFTESERAVMAKEKPDQFKQLLQTKGT